MSQLAGVGPSSAIVTIDPKNGDILTMASTQTYGRSKGKSTYNLATQGKRQPGSSFKTMALLTALREGVNPSSTTYTSKSPMKITKPPCGSPADPWELKTYGGKGAGTMDLRRATLASDNSVYAQLVSDLGPDKVKETARMMGIKSKLLGVCAESLGGLTDGVSPLEMANAYATIVNGGYRTRPRAIKKIERNGEKIKLPKRWRVKRTKAFEDGVTDQAVQILAANAAGGTGTKSLIPGLRGPGRQDRHDRQEHRRLVRRLHPEVRHLGVGRLPGLGQDLDERPVLRLQHRRRHVPGADLGRLHEEGRRQGLREVAHAQASRSTARRSRAATRVRAPRTTKTGDGRGRHGHARRRSDGAARGRRAR